MTETMQTKAFTLIVVAGGSGKRMLTETPKQFLLLAGKPILMRTIEVFAAYNSDINIILVLPENQFKTWKSLCQQHNFTIKHKLTVGGATRFDSVKNGLKLAPDVGLIAVHDGVRPLVSVGTIDRCLVEADKTGASIPVVEVEESIRRISGNSSKAIDRSDYKIVQTPQVFDASILKNAYKQTYMPNFTDDASVVEANGHKISLVAGNTENIKITTAIDLRVAELMIK